MSEMKPCQHCGYVGKGTCCAFAVCEESAADKERFSVLVFLRSAEARSPSIAIAEAISDLADRIECREHRNP
jgi:hypothetical protein